MWRPAGRVRQFTDPRRAPQAWSAVRLPRGRRVVISAGAGNRFAVWVSLPRSRRAPQARSGFRFPGGRRAGIPGGGGIPFSVSVKCPRPAERGRRRAPSVCLEAGFAGTIRVLFHPRVFFILLSSLFSILLSPCPLPPATLLRKAGGERSILFSILFSVLFLIL